MERKTERRGKEGTQEGAGRREEMGAGGRQGRGYSIESIHLWPSWASLPHICNSEWDESQHGGALCWSCLSSQLPSNITPSRGRPPLPSPLGKEAWMHTSIDRHKPTAMFRVCAKMKQPQHTLFLSPCLSAWALVGSSNLKGHVHTMFLGRAGLALNRVSAF